MRKLISILFFSIFLCPSFAQTTLIDPSMEGGFENGNTPALNGWITANSSIDKWIVGNTPGVNSGNGCAYISPDGSAWQYSEFNVIQHLYKTFTVPMGQNLLSLDFKWKANGEGTTTIDLDNLKVFAVPVSYTIVENVPISPQYQISGASATSGMYKLSSANFNGAVIDFTLTPEMTYNIVFSWKSNATILSNPPAAIDDVSLISKAATTITSTSIGGLWSSAETWVGGVVPNNENVIIADGAIITIDQIVKVNDLTIGQGTSGILQWNSASTNAINALGNVTINAGANLNMFSPFTVSSNPNGTYVYVGGDFINNGKVHAGYVNTLGGGTHAGIFFNNPNSNPTLGGTGIFVNGIISLLYFETTGNATINTTQNIVTRNFAMKAGTLNTNGKLSIDNTAYIFGQPENQKIYEIVVTNMGSGYSTSNPPIITIASPGVGTNATAIPNIDNVTGTLRSIKITNTGNGYRTHMPPVTISGGAGTGATAVAVVNLACLGTTVSGAFQSGEATITGGVNIKSDQSIGTIAVNINLAGHTNGVGYTSAPLVGLPLPAKSALNLVTNSGSGYTSLPGIAISGGTKLLSSYTDPTFTVVVANGKVVSVVCVVGGTGWTSIPTLTVVGGGGTGATCAFPAGCLAQAFATISNGAVTNYTITNPGFGYPTPTPTPSVNLEGGGFTTAATAPATRVALYNLTLSKYAPAVSDVVHQENGLVPANRRINNLTMSSTQGVNFLNDVELYANAPISLALGKINMGSKTLSFSYPSYAGTAGTSTAYVSGKIKLATQGGLLVRTFPFESTLSVNTGTGSLIDGSSLKSLSASSFDNPSGTVVGGGYVTGIKGYRVQTNTGESYGTNPTITINYNPIDGLVSDNQSLFIGQSATSSGPWNVRTIASTVGPLPASGSRTTDITAPGPIVPTTDDYYAWVSKSLDITSIASGNWNNPAIWSTGVVPTCTDRIFVNTNHTITVSTTGNKCKSVVVANTGNLIVQTVGNLLVGSTCP
jgi:hypothetical protein